MNMLPKREEGQGLVEYALILVLVAVAVIVILQLLGPNLVLVYARVIGGLDGRTLNTNGPHGLVVSYTTNASSSSGGECTATISDITLIATNDGRIITNESVAFQIYAEGGPTGSSMTANASGSGLINVAGPMTRSGPCPLKLVVQR